MNCVNSIFSVSASAQYNTIAFYSYLSLFIFNYDNRVAIMWRMQTMEENIIFLCQIRIGAKRERAFYRFSRQLRERNDRKRKKKKQKQTTLLTFNRTFCVVKRSWNRFRFCNDTDCWCCRTTSHRTSDQLCNEQWHRANVSHFTQKKSNQYDLQANGARHTNDVYFMKFIFVLFDRIRYEKCFSIFLVGVVSCHTIGVTVTVAHGK